MAIASLSYWPKEIPLPVFLAKGASVSLLTFGWWHNGLKKPRIVGKYGYRRNGFNGPCPPLL
jgi:hypothetical protein